MKKVVSNMTIHRDPNTTSDRYVINTDAYNPVWHRVNEQQTKVYTVETQCGLTYQYPNPNVTFRHPTSTRRFFRSTWYLDCQECTQHA